MTAHVDKRYKRGIRIGPPLKTEQSLYDEWEQSPPHPGPINPESGARGPRRSSMYGVILNRKSKIRVSKAWEAIAVQIYSNELWVGSIWE